MSLSKWPQHIGKNDFVLPTPETLVSACISTLSKNLSSPLLHDSRGWINREEFLQRTLELAGSFKQIGLCKGDRILISGPSSINLTVAHMAALRSGLIVVPVNGL